MEVTRASGIFFVNTGLAVMNLRATGVKLTVHLRDHTSQEVATAEESVAGYGHLAQFVHEFGWSQDIDFDEFQGTLEVRVDGAIAATVLQTRPGQFATMPVIPLMLP
ncbi:MAG: hypothetical protein P8Y94_05955 [Acidobacteriota bacterium]